MNNPKLIRIDVDVLEAVTKLAKENDRSIPKQINRMLREDIRNIETWEKTTMSINEMIPDQVEPVKIKGPYSKG